MAVNKTEGRSMAERAIEWVKEGVKKVTTAVKESAVAELKDKSDYAEAKNFLPLLPESSGKISEFKADLFADKYPPVGTYIMHRHINHGEYMRKHWILGDPSSKEKFLRKILDEMRTIQGPSRETLDKMRDMVQELKRRGIKVE